MTDKLINSTLQSMTRDQLIQELHHAHSEEFVLMFLGYLAGKVPQLRTVACDHLLKSWEDFKTEMGK